VHATPDARLALVCLVSLAGTLTLARVGEARFAARDGAAQRLETSTGERAPVRTGAAPRMTGEGARLRDGAGIDPNRASADELALLPGIGPRLAAEIVATRARLGGFRSVDELGKVRGIGARKLATLRPFLRSPSERLEQPADPEGDVDAAEHPATLERDAATYVEAERPCAREQVVGADDQVDAGTCDDVPGATLADEEVEADAGERHDLQHVEEVQALDARASGGSRARIVREQQGGDVAAQRERARQADAAAEREARAVRREVVGVEQSDVPD